LCTNTNKRFQMIEVVVSGSIGSYCFYAMLCYAMLCYAILYYTTWLFLTPYYYPIQQHHPPHFPHHLQYYHCYCYCYLSVVLVVVGGVYPKNRATRGTNATVTPNRIGSVGLVASHATAKFATTGYCCM
jgi:hypothetical protein